jgi:arginyl-tRNA synthetase
LKSFKIHIAERISAIAGVDKSKFIEAFEMPPSEQMGDLALPAFVFQKLAKDHPDLKSRLAELKNAPPVIASHFAKAITPDDIIERIESKGPYLNFYLRHTGVLTQTLTDISIQKSEYGKSSVGDGKTIVIDYSSPNIAKPFGIGHLRSTVIGAALKRIYQYQGYEVIGVNHLGDWGTQFGKVIMAYRLWGDDAILKETPVEHLYDLYVRFHREEEADPELTVKARNEFRKLEDADPDNLALWRKFAGLTKEEFSKIYNILGVSFESDAGESFYNDKIANVENLLEQKGLLSISRDATIVDLEKFGMQPLLVKKSDDTTLYATRDLAAAIYRKETYHFHKSLYVVNVAQSLHFKQLFKTLELMGFEWSRDCHHVSFGWVKLGDEMMSTRKGNIVLLEDVINKAVSLARSAMDKGNIQHPDPDKTAREIGIGAVVFTDLAYRRDTDISFDWERMLDFSGNSGPYLQYTHARICSVIRKYAKPVGKTFSAEFLTLPEEYVMTKQLSQFPDIIDKAANEFEPFYISSYLLELCGTFNTYYQKYKSPEDRIIAVNPERAQARIILVDCVGHILRKGLSILGLDAPEIM